MILNDNLIPYFNFAIVVIVVVFALIGVKNGFVKQFLELLSFIVALVIAWLYSPVLARFFRLYQLRTSAIENSEILKIVNYRLNCIIWFVILFAIMSLLLLIVKFLINTLGNLPIINYLNYFLGGCFGAVKGLLIVMLLSLCLSNAFFMNGTEFKTKTFYKILDRSFARAFSYLAKTMEESAEIQRFISNPKDITEQQRQTVEKWLSRNGYNQEQITTVFDSIARE